MSFDSIHITSDGTRWSIRELLASNQPRVSRKASVNTLWSRNAWRRNWGSELPSPARLITHPEFRQALRVDSQCFSIQYINTIEDHVARIISFINSLRSGKSLNPLVIGPDGTLWDGMHRLAAMYILGISDVEVLDFNMDQVQSSQNLEDIFHKDFLGLKYREEYARRFASGFPYRHIYLPNVLRYEIADLVLEEVKSLPWQLAETYFYEQYEVSLLDCDSENIGVALQGLRNVTLSKEFSSLLSEITDLPSLRIADIACHKSLTSQQIGIHTDFSDDGEVCRLTLHLNPDWQMHEGGFFVIFDSPNPTSASAAYLPMMNSAILFEISECSFHAVTPVDGQRPRYSIVIAATQV